MKHKFMASLITLFVTAFLFGTTYSAWVHNITADTNNPVQANVPFWDFGEDSDFARIGNVGNCSYLIASKETTILAPHSNEAIRLTNTAGKSTKDHTFNISTDRDYTVGELRFLKIEFDYYHAEKREQVDKGFPAVQLLCDNVKKGGQQGAVETADEKSPFIVSHIDENWWHLEYFITALTPTMVDHGDTALNLSQKINGIQIIDKSIYDHHSMTGFAIIDNLRFSAESASRLGLFNRTTTVSVGGYYWVKVAWAGELQSVTFTFSDDTIAKHDDQSTKSPFYIKGLKAGNVTITAIVTLVNGQVLSISNNLTVN